MQTIYLENEFGERTQNYVLGGSSQVNCSFTVDAANANGLGISGLSGQGVSAVYMHTSQTPATGNPNPAVGLIMVKLANNYAAFVSARVGLRSPNSGSSINVTTGVTGGNAYVITAVGSTTAAGFQTLGLPTNIVPAVGVAFVAPSTTTATGTGTIQLSAQTGSGLSHIEVIGNPSESAAASDGTGSLIILQALAATNSTTTTLKEGAPADGTVIELSFNMQQAIGPII